MSKGDAPSKADRRISWSNKTDRMLNRCSQWQAKLGDQARINRWFSCLLCCRTDDDGDSRIDAVDLLHSGINTGVNDCLSCL